MVELDAPKLAARLKRLVHHWKVRPRPAPGPRRTGRGGGGGRDLGSRQTVQPSRGLGGWEVAWGGPSPSCAAASSAPPGPPRWEAGHPLCVDATRRWRLHELLHEGGKFGGKFLA